MSDIIDQIAAVSRAAAAKEQKIVGDHAYAEPNPATIGGRHLYNVWCNYTHRFLGFLEIAPHRCDEETIRDAINDMTLRFPTERRL